MALYAMYKELHGKKHRITSLYPVFGIIFGVVVDMHGLLLSVLVLPNVHSTPLNDTLTMQFVNVFIALTSFGLLLSVSALGLYAMYYWSGRPMKGLLDKIKDEDDPLDFAKQRIGRNILLK
jgi:hypothetical protein